MNLLRHSGIACVKIRMPTCNPGYLCVLKTCLYRCLLGGGLQSSVTACPSSALVRSRDGESHMLSEESSRLGRMSTTLIFCVLSGLDTGDGKSCWYRCLLYALRAFFNPAVVSGNFIPSVDVSPLCLHLFTARRTGNHSSDEKNLPEGFLKKSGTSL